MARVQLKNILKKFESGPVIKDVSLTIEDREFFVLVGPSGCGKSTLLRLIAGLEDANAGDVLIDGREVNRVPPGDRNVSMVFQNFALYPHMTVYENMAFGLRLRGYSRAEVESRVKEAAEMLGLQSLLDRRPGEISGGQRQRVAVGRAIVRRPKVFLFDEPLSNLDAKLRVQMRGELLELQRRLQTTMIYVTHDQTEAMTMGDRLCVLRQGTVQQVARPLELYRYPRNRFVAEFIGSPSMNFFDVMVVEKENNLWLDQGHFRLRLPPRYKLGCPLTNGQKVILGIRPEDIHDRLFQPGSAADGNSLLAIVHMLEPVGSETFVHVEAGGTRFVARVDSHNPVEMNQPIEILFNMDNIHLYSPESEERLPLEM